MVSEKIFGDEMRIEQVIVNFLTNAIKYSPGTHQATLNVELKNGQLYLGVKDNGIGMQPELVKRVFEKFYRVEETSHRFQGLGIGLYISAEIIKRHGGQINVKSVYGEGSEFYFTMPINQTNTETNSKD